MWKLVGNDVFSQIQNGKSVKFYSKDSFFEFIREIGEKTGLFINENIYNDNLILSFDIKESICKEKGYYYGSIELNWSYKIEDIIDMDNVITYKKEH